MTNTTLTPPRAGAARRNELRSGTLPGYAFWACLGGSVAASALVFALAAWNLPLFAVLAALLLLASSPILNAAVRGGRHGSNAFWTTLVWLAFGLALVPLVSIIVTVLVNGVAGMLEFGFFGSDMAGVTGVQDQAATAGESGVLGGIKHALIGSLLITLVATLISVPIGLLTSIWLVEYARGGLLARLITFLVDVMTGIPSIVAGLFAAGVLMAYFEFIGGGYSGGQQVMGFTAAVALSVLMIPVVVRSTEEMLRVVPNELREASYALGVRKWRTIFKVVIPTAISGIASGVTLAIARVAGETAPILLTAGMAVTTNWNVFKGWMMTLPVFIYQQLMRPTAPSAPDPSTQRAWGAALVLIIIVMLLNLIARLIAAAFAPKTSGR